MEGRELIVNIIIFTVLLEQGTKYEDSLGVMLTETEKPSDTIAALSYPEVVDNVITLLYISCNPFYLLPTSLIIKCGDTATAR